MISGGLRLIAKEGDRNLSNRQEMLEQRMRDTESMNHEGKDLQ